MYATDIWVPHSSSDPQEEVERVTENVVGDCMLSAQIRGYNKSLFNKGTPGMKNVLCI